MIGVAPPLVDHAEEPQDDEQTRRHTEEPQYDRPPHGAHPPSSLRKLRALQGTLDAGDNAPSRGIRPVTPWGKLRPAATETLARPITATPRHRRDGVSRRSDVLQAVEQPAGTTRRSRVGSGLRAAPMPTRRVNVAVGGGTDSLRTAKSSTRVREVGDS
jgi:hypothetical protein